MKRILAATAALASCIALAPTAMAADHLPNHRPWWDPTKVLESPVDPARAEGTIENVQLTADGSDSHTVTVTRGTPTYSRVQSTVSGLTPGQYYTVRITLREQGTGDDWGVYTWQAYQATEEGKLHINLRMLIPTRARTGENIIAVPTVYNSNDVRRDGRPAKQDPTCVLECKRVAPLAAWTDLTSPEASITIG